MNKSGEIILPIGILFSYFLLAITQQVSPFSPGIKFTEILACDNANNHNTAPIPLRPNCDNLQVNSKVHVENVDVEVFKLNLTKAEIVIFSCEKRSVKHVCYENLLGGLTKTKNVKITNHNLMECKEKWEEEEKELLFEIPEYLRDHSQLLIDTENNIEDDYDCQWMRESTTEMFHWILTAKKERIDYLTEQIIVDHKEEISCSYLEFHCHFKTSSYFWNKIPDQYSCKLTLYGTYSSIISLDQLDNTTEILIDQHDLLFHFDTNIRNRGRWCDGLNKTVYLSKEDIYIGICNKTLDELESELIKDDNNLKNNYSIENSPSSSEEKPLDYTALSKHVETTLSSSHENYIINIINKLESTRAQNLRFEKCQSEAWRWELAWSMRIIDMDYSSRLFLNQRDITGTISGGTIIYRKCRKTNDYTLKQNGSCGEMWKIEGEENMCLDLYALKAKKCPAICPPTVSSYLYQINRTHIVDLIRYPKIFKSNLLYLPNKFHNNRIHWISEEELYSPHELSRLDLLFTSVSDIIKGTNDVLHSKSKVASFSNSTSLMDHFVKSILNQLGVLSGKVTILGSVIWVSFIAPILMFWMILSYKVINLLASLRLKCKSQHKTVARSDSNAPSSNFYSDSEAISTQDSNYSHAQMHSTAEQDMPCQRSVSMEILNRYRNTIRGLSNVS